MGDRTKIQWADATWNPATGCTKVSDGCKHCYAETMALRLKAMGQRNYANGFLFTTHERALDQPLRWTRPRLIFVNSMSDTFHEGMDPGFRARMFAVMRRAHWHRFLVLTKRAPRLLEYALATAWPANVWAGVTVESKLHLGRLDYLRAVPARIRFVSFEPLLTRIPEPDLRGIHWIIVGGESGPKSRPVDADWVRELRDRAVALGVAFFFKQWGGPDKRAAGAELDGREWQEMPAAPQEARA